MEDDGFGFDLPVLNVDFVATENDGDVLADPGQIAVPVGHVLVGHTRGHVEHNHSALSWEIFWSGAKRSEKSRFVKGNN